MGIYQTPSELQYLMQMITLEFPEIVSKIKIGNTYEMRDINLYVLTIGNYS